MKRLIFLFKNVIFFSIEVGFDPYRVFAQKYPYFPKNSSPAVRMNKIQVLLRKSHRIHPSHMAMDLH